MPSNKVETVHASEVKPNGSYKNRCKAPISAAPMPTTGPPSRPAASTPSTLVFWIAPLTLTPVQVEKIQNPPKISARINWSAILEELSSDSSRFTKVSFVNIVAIRT